MSIDNQSGADERANEAFLAWMRTAPQMKDEDHPIPLSFIAGFKAALQAHPSAPANPNAMIPAHLIGKYIDLEIAVRDQIAMFHDTSDEFNMSGAAIADALNAIGAATPADMPASDAANGLTPATPYMDRITRHLTKAEDEIFLRALKARSVGFEMPRLPMPATTVYGDNRTVKGHYFSADQMRIYGRDCAEYAAAPKECAKPVARVESWTNGSYHRNYKLTWLQDVEAGAELYAAPQQPVAAISEPLVWLYHHADSTIKDAAITYSDPTAWLAEQGSFVVIPLVASTTVMQAEVSK